MSRSSLPWAGFFNRCRAYREWKPGEVYWGRCELRRLHDCDHALERGMDIMRWSTEWTNTFRHHGRID